VNDYSRSTVFDQRGQRVRYQYNAAGDINFGAAQDRQEAVAGLRKFRAELERAIQSGVLNEDKATIAGYQLKKAVQQAEKPYPNKQAILGHLEKVKEVISSVAANVAPTTELIAAVSQAIHMVQRLF
jgi:hypothetical protein